MSAVAKGIYKPLSLTTSVLGGIAAGMVFKQIWKHIGDNDAQAPNPKDLDRSAREVLIAAVIQGAIFGLVKAAVDRAGATGYRAMTHESPVQTPHPSLTTQAPPAHTGLRTTGRPGWR